MMDEARVRDILGPMTAPDQYGWVKFERVIEAGEYASFHLRTGALQLDGEFSPDELEAFAALMRSNSQKPEVNSQKSPEDGA